MLHPQFSKKMQFFSITRFIKFLVLQSVASDVRCYMPTTFTSSECFSKQLLTSHSWCHKTKNKEDTSFNLTSVYPRYFARIWYNKLPLHLFRLPLQYFNRGCTSSSYASNCASHYQSIWCVRIIITKSETNL